MYQSNQLQATPKQEVLMINRNLKTTSRKTIVNLLVYYSALQLFVISLQSSSINYYIRMIVKQLHH